MKGGSKMEITSVKCFIDALKEWDKVTGEKKSTDFNSLIYYINMMLYDDADSLGFVGDITAEERLKVLEDRIMYLIVEQKVHEVFLVTSLINGVSKYLGSRIDAMLTGIQLAVNVNKKNEEKPENLQVNEHLKYLLSYEHRYATKNEYFRWQRIVANNLSEEHIESWERNIVLKMFK
jgi:hypothetical protein